MRFTKFLLVALLTTALTILADRHQPFKSSLPRLGAFLSPFTGFWQQADQVNTESDTEILNFPEIEQPVKILIDHRLVPHIFAQNIKDAAFAQGYITAKHRLWQMDLSYRSISGRMSEVLGERALEYDRLQRRLGFVEIAKQTLIGWQTSDIDRKLVNSYTAGVNAYIQSLQPADYPIEFKLLGYAPETWTPLKSALFVQNLAKMLSFRYNDIEATNVRNLFGQEMYDFLFPDWNPKQAPVIPDEVSWDFTPVDTLPAASPGSLIGEVIPYRTLPQPHPNNGSNNWAVSGRKTVSGNPVLCNDMHLTMTLPAIWYEIQIHCQEMNAYGVSSPGAPGIVVGFNEKLAWGFTNVGHDVLDWYTIAWTDSTRQAYYLDNEIQTVSRIEERIGVRGWSEPFLDTVKYTSWGPVVYEQKGAKYEGMAMYWLPSQVQQEQEFYELGALYHMATAQNYEEHQRALSALSYPAQNVAFAAQDGDIALTVMGRLPLKRPQQGKFVQDGSLSGNAWAGFIPWEHNPRVRNPEQGFVASANQHSTTPDYPYYYYAPFDDYRGRFIDRALTEFDSASVEVTDMMALQANTHSLLAEEGLPTLINSLDQSNLNEHLTSLLDILKSWDYSYKADAEAPVIFEKWREQAYQLTFDELNAFRDSLDIGYPETWRFLDLIENHSEHQIFDKQTTVEAESASDIVTEAFFALDSLDFAKDWGAAQPTIIRHMLRLPAFSYPELRTGGAGSAPNAIRRSHGPSWRMIVEMDDYPKAWGVYPGGQSGNPASPYYDNFIDKWAKGEYYELFFMKNEEDRGQEILFTMDLSKK